MSESKNQTRPGVNRQMRQALLRSLAAIFVLGAGIATVYGLETMLNAVFDKPPAPLSKPLPEMSRKLGTRYVAEGSDEVLDPEMVESLGTSEYLLRQYRDLTLAPDAPGARVNLNINFYATGTSTPHVPEICWAGAGLVEAPASRRMFVVDGLKRKDGHGNLTDITMKMISFIPRGGPTVSDTGEPIYSNVAYVFQVNGMYVSGTQEVTSLFWKASYRYAYHSKIEVTPMDSTGGSGVLVCTQEQAQKIIRDFIREALPEVEACLPDPSILTQADAGTDAGAKSSEQR